ncbi:MAG: hypothetical protein WBV94_20600 [Blastocatellia bacterium]
MNWFSHIKKVLDKVVHGIGHLFSDENIRRAEEVADHISDLATLALPYVEKFATLTPGTQDDELVAAAERMNLSLQDILSEPDDAVRKGRILTLIGNATKAKIQDLVANAGGQKIKIGSTSIRVPDDIGNVAGDLYDSAAQFAYSLFVKRQAKT